MKFIVKYFPEITIKSKPVRRQFSRQLRDNLRSVLRPIDESVEVEQQWDKLIVTSQATDFALEEMIQKMSCTPGIAYFLYAESFPLGDLDDIYKKTQQIWGERLKGKTFVVRCKRVGEHNFSSIDVERYIGGGLNQHTDAAGVKLKGADITVNLEIRDDTLFVVKETYPGIGGFPLGGIDSVLSLISGGFDSTVSSYLTMQRGMRTHFCFFNLGGRAHEIAVKEVAYYLWQKYGSSHRVKFITIPFEGVVAELLENIYNPYMGVILKRMMLRAAEQVAKTINVEALVTGESVAQVSSQTLRNLSVIDKVADTLVLRPLITMNKGDIINLSAKIGTEDFAKNIPEYCGVISVKPTTRAKEDRIIEEESRFDFSILQEAIANRQEENINELQSSILSVSEVDVVAEVPQLGVILDIRHPNERELKPIATENKIVSIPFYQLPTKFPLLDKVNQYYLYCDKGVMSRLHASHLLEEGYKNISVWRPE